MSALINLGCCSRAGRLARRPRPSTSGAWPARPDHTGLRLNLGNVLLDHEDWAGAERHPAPGGARKAPQDIQVATSLSRALLELGRYDEAMALCHSIIARQPEAVRRGATCIWPCSGPGAVRRPRPSCGGSP